MDYVLPETNPFAQACAQLKDLLQGDPTTGFFRALFYQFAAGGEAMHLEMVERLRTKILDMDGHLQWRCVDEFSDPIYLLPHGSSQVVGNRAAQCSHQILQR